jgi:hypothetical protein
MQHAGHFWRDLPSRLQSLSADSRRAHSRCSPIPIQRLLLEMWLGMIDIKNRNMGCHIPVQGVSEAVGPFAASVLRDIDENPAGARLFQVAENREKIAVGCIIVRLKRDDRMLIVL